MSGNGYGPPSTPSSAEDERTATRTRSPSRLMTLHSPPRCLTFGRTPLTPRLQFFLQHPSTCLLWLLSLRPTYAGSFSPLLRNPASLTLFLHPYCRSLSMSFSRSSPSSATTPSVKELCLRPRSDPSWFLSSSARGWMPHTHNKNQTKEVDRAHSKRRITVKNGNRRENARKKIKRKTKTNDAGLDDGGRI